MNTVPAFGIGDGHHTLRGHYTYSRRALSRADGTILQQGAAALLGLRGYGPFWERDLACSEAYSSTHVRCAELGGGDAWPIFRITLKRSCGRSLPDPRHLGYVCLRLVLLCCGVYAQSVEQRGHFPLNPRQLLARTGVGHDTIPGKGPQCPSLLLERSAAQRNTELAFTIRINSVDGAGMATPFGAFVLFEEFRNEIPRGSTYCSHRVRSRHGFQKEELT